MRLLAYDPGGTTGFARWDDGEWRAWHQPWQEAGERVQTELISGLDVLVCEDFFITAHTATKSQDGKVSIELIGVGRYLAKSYDVPFVLQPPSDAKSFADNRKLKAMGMWTKGLDHPRDATRHMLLYLAKNRLIDLAALRASL